MERPARSLTLDGVEYAAMFTGVTDTIDGVKHMSVRFTDPQSDDHFHARFRVPIEQDPDVCFSEIPLADLERGLREALARAATRPVP